MAFGIRRRAASTITKNSVKKPKVHEIDGCRYKSKALLTLHQALKENPLVDSFSLPTVQEEAITQNKKYGAKKCEINNNKFDSVMEARFYVHLLGLMNNGTVTSFEKQYPFILQDKYKDPFTGKTIQAIKYISDFYMTMKDGTKVVIDVKGQETPEFKLKKKMFGYKYRNVQFMCVQWSERHKDWLDLEDIKKESKERKKAKKGKAA